MTIHEYNGSLWTCPSDFVVITTNGTVKKNGEAVMGRGCAYEATQILPGIQKALGSAIRSGGNRAYYFAQYNLFTLPVKHRWDEKADVQLVTQSLRSLAAFVTEERGAGTTIAMPRPGCGNGGLNWDKDVAPIAAHILDPVDSDFMVCHTKVAWPKIPEELATLPRVLITGDRNWSDFDTIKKTLTESLTTQCLVIHGDARGADKLAAQAATQLGHVPFAVPAPWDILGKSAGPKRNDYMLSLEPQHVFAFHDDLSKSKGTRHCVEAAKALGIPGSLTTSSKGGGQ